MTMKATSIRDANISFPATAPPFTFKAPASPMVRVWWLTAVSSLT